MFYTERARETERESEREKLTDLCPGLLLDYKPHGGVQ